MNLTWLLLILAIALIVLGALRFDVLVARWRELTDRPPGMGEAPPPGPTAERPPGNPGLHPHAAPPQKPDFHRSGRRH
ncbi:hypothetical protein [Roseateles sp.]|uniref:hypothetical protein n=1 Tax=Roseateles sp. TaxID=1971397 RepID=UPI0025CDD15A|nr:hypothetical protein [Roseateles sp.]MBV8033954.1 hypothetical protein [Roseateles sp.]